MPRPFIFSDEQVQTMVDLYDSGWGTTEIPRMVEFACTSGQVKNALRRSGVIMRPFGLGRPQKSIPLSPATLRMVDGMLLGDGHLVAIKPPLVNSGFAMHVSAEHNDFVGWVASYFLRDNIPFNKHTKPNSWPGSFACVLSTAKTKQFTVIRKRWYPTGLKIIPADLCLYPETVLAWYLGDGTLHSHAGVTLCTNGFLQPDVELLQQLLLGVGIRSNLKLHKRGSSGFSAVEKVDPLLYVPRGNGNLRAFFDFIGPCPVPSLAYKWQSQ